MDNHSRANRYWGEILAGILLPPRDYPSSTQPLSKTGPWVDILLNVNIHVQL